MSGKLDIPTKAWVDDRSHGRKGHGRKGQAREAGFGVKWRSHGSTGHGS